MKIFLLAFVALDAASTWKRSTDTTTADKDAANKCALVKYDIYAKVNWHNSEAAFDIYTNWAASDATGEYKTHCKAGGRKIACDCSDTEGANAKEDAAQCTYVTDLLKANPLADTTMYKKGLEAFKGLVCNEKKDDKKDEKKDLPYLEELPFKAQCNMVIYYILAKGNPEEYPLMDGDKPIWAHTSNDGACVIIEEGTGDYVETVKDCACSHPGEYNFLDKDTCKFAKEAMGDSKHAFEKKMLALTCGPSSSMANFLSVGLMILCSLLK